jgi:hypothetical protein
MSIALILKTRMESYTKKARLETGHGGIYLESQILWIQKEDDN